MMLMMRTHHQNRVTQSDRSWQWFPNLLQTPARGEGTIKLAASINFRCENLRTANKQSTSSACDIDCEQLQHKLQTGVYSGHNAFRLFRLSQYLFLSWHTKMFSVTVAGESVSFLVPTKNDESEHHAYCICVQPFARWYESIYFVVENAHEQLDHCLHDDPEFAIHYNKQRNALRENAQSIPLSGKLVVRHDLPLYWAAAKVAWSVRKGDLPS